MSDQSAGASLHTYDEDQDLVVVNMQDSVISDGEWWFDGVEELDNLIQDLVEASNEASEIASSTETGGDDV